MPPIASFAFLGTARELTWYCLVALTPSDAGIAYSSTNMKTKMRQRRQKPQYMLNKCVIGPTMTRKLTKEERKLEEEDRRKEFYY